MVSCANFRDIYGQTFGQQSHSVAFNPLSFPTNYSFGSKVEDKMRVLISHTLIRCLREGKSETVAVEIEDGVLGKYGQGKGRRNVNETLLWRCGEDRREKYS